MKNCNPKTQALKFMDTITSDFSDSKKCFIVVTHLVDNTIDFLNTLSKKGRVAGLIAKPNSVDEKTKKQATCSGIKILDFKRTDFFIDSTISQKVSPLIQNDEKLIILFNGNEKPNTFQYYFDNNTLIIKDNTGKENKFIKN